jgi:hypothetical protein
MCLWKERAECELAFTAMASLELQSASARTLFVATKLLLPGNPFEAGDARGRKSLALRAQLLKPFTGNVIS